MGTAEGRAEVLHGSARLEQGAVMGGPESRDPSVRPEEGRPEGTWMRRRRAAECGHGGGGGQEDTVAWMRAQLVDVARVWCRCGWWMRPRSFFF